MSDVQKENEDLKATLDQFLYPSKAFLISLFSKLTSLSTSPAEFRRENDSREARLAEALKETADHASAIGHYQIAVDELNELIGTLKEEQSRLEGVVDEDERQIEFMETSMVGLQEKVEELENQVEGEVKKVSLID